MSKFKKEKKKLSLSEFVEQSAPGFNDRLFAAEVSELKDILATLAKQDAAIEQAREKDEDLNKAKEDRKYASQQIKDLDETYKQPIKLNRNKRQLVLEFLAKLEGDGNEK